MLRSCEECRQVVAQGDIAEWTCATCGGIFHGVCVRNKKRPKTWHCSGCQGKKQEKGLLVAEAVNKLIDEKEDTEDAWWAEMESPSHQLDDASSSDYEDIDSPLRHDQSKNGAEDSLSSDSLDIDSSGVCTRCGLISIPKIHVWNCVVCKKNTAHSLCNKQFDRKRYTCPSCTSRRSRITDSTQYVIKPLLKKIAESAVVLCDHCQGEFSMATLNMSKLPKGDWFCHHCDDHSPDIEDLATSSKRARESQSASPRPDKRAKSSTKSSKKSSDPTPLQRSNRSSSVDVALCSRCGGISGKDQKCRECRRVSKMGKAKKRERVPLRVAIPEPAEDIILDSGASVDLWSMHEMVGRTVVVYMATNGQWLSGCIAFFDPHTLLHRVQFLDDTEQWLPLYTMAHCVSEQINVFVKLQPPHEGWWPGQLMRLSTVARQYINESSEKLVYLYGADNVCAWVSMSSVRCFDVFELEAKQESTTWLDAVDEAKEEIHLARETVEDAKETLRRDIEKRLGGKKWIGKKVEVMNFSHGAIYHGTITKFNPTTSEYWLDATDQDASKWFLVNDDVHISLVVDCSYTDLSMQWYADPDAVLQDTHKTLTTSSEKNDTRCIKCLFPLQSEVLLPCSKCEKLFHRSCVDCPQDAYPLLDKDGTVLIEDIHPPFICPDCSVCDGCDATSSDTWHRWKLPLTPVTLCTGCIGQYIEHSYCPVCHKTFGAFDFCTDAIQCTSCDLWVHTECEPDPDPMYHSVDLPIDFELGPTIESAAEDSTALDLTDKQRRRLNDDKIARRLIFSTHYDPRVMSKYECYTCRRVRCFRLLKALVAEDKFLLFREPVTVEIAPTYFEVIKAPMDLRTMENNLKDQQYVHALCADFRDHFELMCLNAVTFNSKERDFSIWREAWRFYNAGLRLLRQIMPSTLIVTGKYSEHMIAAAKRQLPNNSVLANKEEPKKEVEEAPPVVDEETDKKDDVVAVERVVETVVIDDKKIIVPTELGSVPKPYSCLSSVVATLSKAQAHEMSWLDVCMVCCSSGQTQAMVFCVDCGEAFHGFCLHPPLDLEGRSEKIQEYWRCPNCKICEFCGRCTPEDESHLLVCDVCERGYHTFCLKPKLREVPSSGFVCGSCVQCESCALPQESTSWSPSASLCIVCSGEDTIKKRTKRSTDCCPVCSRKWMASEPLIQCDGCELWVHPKCDSITKETLELLADDPTSEYFCPDCRKKQRQHLDIYENAWSLQRNVALIQDKRQEIAEAWQTKLVNEQTTRQWDHWREHCPVYLYIMRLGEDCLKSLAGRRLSFQLSTQATMAQIQLIPLGIRHRASRYLRFKRYARGPRAALRRQNRKKEQFFSWEGVKAKESAIANVVSEAVSAASFLACCAWLYGTKKLTRFTAELLRASGETIPDAVLNHVIDPTAISMAEEVKFLAAEYKKRTKVHKQDTEVKAEPAPETPVVPPTPPPVVEVLPESQAHMTIIKPLHGWELWDHLSHLGTFEDRRMCGFCRGLGDSSVCGRLIFADYDQWVHVNCAFWSNEVYEDAYGTMLMCQKARFRGRTTRCSVCGVTGATVGCHGLRCQLNFHFPCALSQQNFTLEKQAFCHQNDHWMAHLKKRDEKKRKKEEEQEAKRRAKGETIPDEEPLSLEAEVELCMNDLVNTLCTENIDATLEPLRFLMSDPLNDKKTSKTQMAKGTCYRVGTLCVQKLGSIEVGNDAFHTKHAIYPVGFRSTRIFWSSKVLEARCLYECEILTEINPATLTKRPLFKITPCDDLENPLFGHSPKDVVSKLRSRVLALYESKRVFRTGWNPFLKRSSWFSYGLLGEHFFGLTIPIIGAAIESLPYAPTTALLDSQNPYPYVFCHVLPTPAMFEDAKVDIKRFRAANEHAKHSSGCARTDGYSWHRLKAKPDISKKRKVNVSKQANDDPSNGQLKPSTGMELLPIPMQYRELRRRPFGERLEVRKSKIHGYGLFVKEAIGEGKMIVEYQGQAIRQKVADMREKRCVLVPGNVIDHVDSLGMKKWA
ncbi:hypothetical protein LEN26_005667 [Aphanomyces euteiches]|nr:hypothetical protein LEN26_005667 [Aphanomyces euteiches]